MACLCWSSSCIACVFLKLANRQGVHAMCHNCGWLPRWVVWPSAASMLCTATHVRITARCQGVHCWRHVGHAGHDRAGNILVMLMIPPVIATYSERDINS